MLWNMPNGLKEEQPIKLFLIPGHIIVGTPLSMEKLLIPIWLKAVTISRIPDWLTPTQMMNTLTPNLSSPALQQEEFLWLKLITLRLATLQSFLSVWPKFQVVLHIWRLEIASRKENTLGTLNSEDRLTVSFSKKTASLTFQEMLRLLTIWIPRPKPCFLEESTLTCSSQLFVMYWLLLNIRNTELNTWRNDLCIIIDYL